MIFNKTLLSVLLLSLFTYTSTYAFDIPLGDDEKSIFLKTTQEEHEHFTKELPFGPTSIKFIDDSLWVADGLKDRLVEYDTNGNYKKSIQLEEMPNYSTAGDFCFGNFRNEKAIYVCDADNAIIYIFNYSGNIIGQIGSLDEKFILRKPYRIEVFDEKIYVYDAERSNIFVYNDKLNQDKAIVTYSNNFAIENEFLFHIFISHTGMKKIDRRNLKTNKTDNHILDIPEKESIDFIAVNNDEYYVGAVKKSQDGSENDKYQISKYNKNNKVSKLDTDLPVSFLVTSFIKNSEGKIYQIKYNPEQPNKLSIEKIEF